MAKFPPGKKPKSNSPSPSPAPSRGTGQSKPAVVLPMAKKHPASLSPSTTPLKNTSATPSKSNASSAAPNPKTVAKAPASSVTKPGTSSTPLAKPNFQHSLTAKAPIAAAKPAPVQTKTSPAVVTPAKGSGGGSAKPAPPLLSGTPAKAVIAPTTKPLAAPAPPAPTMPNKPPAKFFTPKVEAIPPALVKTQRTAVMVAPVALPAAPSVRDTTELELPGIARVKSAKAPATRGKTKTPAPGSDPSAGGKKRILFVTAECSPLAQSGGLGDAVAGLTKALHKQGHDVRIVMPLFQFIDRARFGITFSRTCCVHFGEGEEIWVGIFEGKLDGEVPIWLVDYGRYFDRPSLYGDPDDPYRFGLLSKASLQVCKDTNFIPHVAHVHDWMSSMVPVFLKTWDRVLSPLSQTASVLTIHNIGYQGKFDPSVLRFYGLGGDYMRPDRLEDFGAINLLKAGIQYADAITTVSPTYAREIREPVGGMGLAPYLNNRASVVSGILNGVDTSVWNPETDKFLPARYSRNDLTGKAACKRALQERFGLRVDPNLPLFGIVSRFAPQKGFDLLRGALPQAMREMAMQVIVLGSGDTTTENFFRWLSDAHPARANAHIGFSPEVAHLIEAGSDFFLMPSIYEPCGLNQMYSSLYGALPVVRATGGLDDTVENYNEAAGTGTGFKFWEISERALYFTIGWAVSTWFDRPRHYRAMQQQGMARDVSWESSAKEYEKVYERAMAARLVG